MEQGQLLERGLRNWVLHMNKAVEDTKLINVLVGRNQNDLEAAKLHYRFDLLKRYMLCGHQHFFFPHQPQGRLDDKTVQSLLS